MSKETLVIGLDGAAWELIKPWADQGKLPTFKKLMENGTWGQLKSTIPPSSPPAWTSAFTGVNPGKHNIFSFFTSKGYDLRLTNATDRKAKPIWKILSEKGLKTIVINVPMTYPPDRINGVMISGIAGSSHQLFDYTYPKKFKSVLTQIGYIIDTTPKKLEDFQRAFEMIEKRRQVVVKLAKSHDWNLFVVVFSAPDRFQHFFWRYMNNSSERTSFRDVIFRIYETLDRVIEELLELIGRNTNVIIISDHGFGPIHKVIFLNNWFRDMGLLKEIEPSKIGLLKSKLEAILKRCLPKEIKAGLRGRRRRKDSGLIALVRVPRSIEWSKTKAWLEQPYRVKINLRGREPLGIVEPGKQYEDLRNDIIQRLCELRDPDNAERVITKVYKREELFHGPYTKNCPDLLIQVREGYGLHTALGEKLFNKPKETLSATHRLYGIFLAYGPDIKRGSEVRNLEIIDVAPTILHMMGVPISRTMDGRVLKEIFERESDLATRTILYEAFREERKRARLRQIYTKEEEEKIRERLERLGYL